MSLFNVMTIAGGGMSSQVTRLNVTASNLSNQNTIAKDEDSAYHALRPVFEAVYDAYTDVETAAKVNVKVSEITKSKEAIRQEYNPEHPMANEDGFIFLSNVNPIEEMVEMISASRSYETNVNLVETAKNLIMKTIQSMDS